MGLHCLKLISNYLINEKQRTRINNSYSSWEDILFRVPQGSIWSPSLFSIFLSDLFLVIDDIDFPAMPMITTFTVKVRALISSFFHCNILLREFFSKTKPNRVK